MRGLCRGRVRPVRERLSVVLTPKKYPSSPLPRPPPLEGHHPRRAACPPAQLRGACPPAQLRGIWLSAQLRGACPSARLRGIWPARLFGRTAATTVPIAVKSSLRIGYRGRRAERTSSDDPLTVSSSEENIQRTTDRPMSSE